MHGSDVQSRFWPFRFAAGALHDFRRTNSHLSKTSRGGKSGFDIRSSMTAIAILPISRHGWCSVVKGTGNRRAYFTSSIPTMAISSGIRLPSASNVCIRLPAVRSLAHTKASGRSFFNTDLMNFMSLASPIVTTSRSVLSPWDRVLRDSQLSAHRPWAQSSVEQRTRCVWHQSSSGIP